jgi:uncharacterized RDD family membrane protein YckC
MAQWAPFRTTPLANGAGLSPAAVAVGEIHACAECGKAFPAADMLQYEGSWVCAACKPKFFQRIKEGVNLRGQYTLANVGARFVAIFVDGILIGILAVILLWPFYVALFASITHSTPGHPFEQPQFSLGFRIYQYFVSYGLPAAYEIFFIGTYGATLGKMLMKVKVVTPDGGRVSYGRATGRHFAKILSGIICYIGYLMAFWDEEKRALHDRICGTRVIVRSEA